MSTTPSRRRRRRLATVAATGLTVVALLALPAGSASAQPGKIRGLDARGAIPDSYLVVLEDAPARTRLHPLADGLAAKHRATIRHRYGSALRGFSARMTRAQALRMSVDPAVAFIEQDRRIEAVGTQTPTRSWGLDRIDQRGRPLDSTFTYPNTGVGVTAYVIDSGIRTTHSDFGGRAVFGTNTTGDSTTTDCDGHGTHVAGIVGGTAYGVAKGVRLVAVKVLGCDGSGSLSGVAAGVDWVTAHHTSGPAVANMSLGASGSSPVLEQAVRSSIADGVVYTLASGNADRDACNYTPARTAEAITVNATTRTDARAPFSNFGSCTDVFAPGESITSAWSTSDTATTMVSGTSMAAPHVAGVAALTLSRRPSLTPAQVWSTLSANATPGTITDPGPGSPNRLLNLGATTTPPSRAACAPVSNGVDVRIPDLRTVSSRVTVSGCAGRASATSTVKIRIKHLARGDLVVDLVSPSGAVVKLHNRRGGPRDNLYVTYPHDLSGYAANGAWRLRVRDTATINTGRIDTWTLDL